ncbi:MAG: PrgI family protein [bacterium]|nr:PrgI family protein [bacterium]
MAQFQVPQFIDAEPKIVGPLTIKQFAYVGIAGMLSFMLFFFLKLAIWLPVTIVLGLIACTFAFLKYNGRPFIVLFINAALYIWKPKLYLWQRQDVAPTMPTAPTMPSIATPSTSKIRSLWLSMITRKSAIELNRPISPLATAPIGKPSGTTVVVHPIKTGAPGSGGNQLLRDLKKRKSDYGY